MQYHQNNYSHIPLPLVENWPWNLNICYETFKIRFCLTLLSFIIKIPVLTVQGLGSSVLGREDCWVTSNHLSYFSQNHLDKVLSNSNPCLFFSVFFFYPPQVLRFYAMWDDTNSMFGENRPYIIHYYLADDTVEVREVHKPNDGRDPFPVLIKRQRLPKTFVDKKSKFREASTSVLKHPGGWM